GGGGGDAMLPGAGLRDDARLAHARGEQRLAEDVVDLVGAGVAEVLALEEDARASAVPGQALGPVERRGPARVALEQPRKSPAEGGIASRRAIRLLELDQRTHERLRDEAAAEAPEVPGGVGQGGGIEPRATHVPSASAARAARTNRRTLSGSFRP